MPTISQLPSATPITAADQVPISQGGTARAASVGALLASAQPAIIVDSPSLLGRTSLGSGGPEQINVGLGVSLSGGTLAANGSDHANFSPVSSLPAASDLVISNEGSPMLLKASLLRGLFSAGSNVAIDSNGIISATTTASSGASFEVGGSIAALKTITGLAGGDLVAVSQAGTDCAIPYDTFLGGVTIDQAQPAGPVNDSDLVWAAQGSDVMASQTFSAIWSWIANKLPSYRAPIIEITSDINLDTTIHNGRILICSQPVTLTPVANSMGSGFQCMVINASGGDLTLGSGFVSSNGSSTLLPWQSATLAYANYSGGTIAFASMATTASAPVAPITAIPGQVDNLASAGATAATIALSWQPPTTGGQASSYIVQFRETGTTSWSGSTAAGAATSYQLTGLQPSTSYDIAVEAENAAGVGLSSAILTIATSDNVQAALPSVTGDLAATSTSSSAITLSWSSQTGTGAATSFTIQYRLTGVPAWTSSLAGITQNEAAISGLQPATSYDFSVFGVNADGAGPSSAVLTAVTQAPPQSVSLITWNLAPSGTYAVASGTVGVNAHVSPSASPIQFGFSLSASTPPSSWTAALLVNTDLWGAYVPIPSTTGSWYAWAEGLDGSAAAVSPSPFMVQ